MTDFVSAADLDDDHNAYGIAIRNDERVFAKLEVTSIGQVVAAIIANDQATAQRAAKLVEVTYKELPTIITMDEAIEARSFHQWNNNQIR